MSNNPPAQIDKTDAFLRYVASVASSVTLGETDPTKINWTYIRDQASRALQRDDRAVVDSTKSDLK